jgi:hypothetical protein
MMPLHSQPLSLPVKQSNLLAFYGPMFDHPRSKKSPIFDCDQCRQIECQSVLA